MDQIPQIIERLAASLGVVSSKIWEAYLRQARVDFYVTTIQYGLIVIANIAFFKWLYRKRENIDDVFPLALIGLCCLAILTLIAFFYLPEYFASIANPDFWAMNEILKKIQQAK